MHTTIQVALMRFCYIDHIFTFILQYLKSRTAITARKPAELKGERAVGVDMAIAWPPKRAMAGWARLR